MSVESDTMRYYAQLDRDTAREDAIEREAEPRADDLQAEAYEWIKTRFGEDAACALIPDAWIDPNPAATIAAAREHFTRWRDSDCALIPDAWIDPNPAATIAAAREHFTRWRDSEAERAAIAYLEG